MCGTIFGGMNQERLSEYKVLKLVPERCEQLCINEEQSVYTVIF
jgi:hypothetical protein